MKAIIIGATGLVGNLILKEILNDNDYSEVRIFVRKPAGISNPKLKEIVSTMEDILSLSSEIKGDVIFNAFGVMKAIDPILTGSYKKYRSMPADKLAKAMVSLSKNPAGKANVLHFPEIMQCL